MSFASRVMHWLTQEAIVKGLAENRGFQQLVLRFHTGLERLGAGAQRRFGDARRHLSRLLDETKK